MDNRNMKKRSIDNNKSIRQVKRGIKTLLKSYPEVEYSFNFKTNRVGSHCYKLIVRTPVAEESFTVIKTNKSYSSNLGIVSKVEKFLDRCLDFELFLHFHFKDDLKNKIALNG
ncbi:hypothetical protein OAZ09_00170 [Gammaproteobacteria bacterium]|nr:hypothetical protein [Gammaproteobacteria bacterium]